MVEHLPFKERVLGSSPSQVTSNTHVAELVDALGWGPNESHLMEVRVFSCVLFFNLFYIKLILNELGDMKKVKSVFSIKNLEHISGIKSHTIRICEKRYKLLSPERTDTNIRKYSLNSLRKLFNITLLYKKDFKISKIANLEPKNISFFVREITLKK